MLLQGGSSENEASSVGSRVNIQQKLHEKKQKQLAELRVIEEEIKQGKLARPSCGPGGGGGGCGGGGGGGGAPSGLEEPRQPIPRAKRHDAADCWPPPSPRPLPPPYSYHIIPPPRAKHRANTPEILLAPHYLESAERLYYGWEPHYGDCASDQGSSVPEDRATSDVEGGGGGGGGSTGGGGGGGGDSVGNGQVVNGSGADAQLMYKSYRIPSDMDSQISLPRSYTLPREFKYYRRPKSRKAVRSQHFVASNNSSDGERAQIIIYLSNFTYLFIYLINTHSHSTLFNNSFYKIISTRVAELFIKKKSNYCTYSLYGYVFQTFN